MGYSEIALKIFVAQAEGIIKTNAQFWKKFPTREDFEEFVKGDEGFIRTVEITSLKLKQEAEKNNKDFNFICIYDQEFPKIHTKIKRNSEKPYLLFYKGDITLLNKINNNIAVIGLIDPDTEIEERERKFVKQLVNQNITIVSGLAKGCDSIAHKVALENSGRTIAILPSTLEKIYPAENKKLAENIVKNKGLLLSEYYHEPKNKFVAIGRFIERDRLQALFSKAVILTASYREGEGDSGSRHAMEAAEKYNIERFIMYNEQIDNENIKFGLNKDYYHKQIQVLKPKIIEKIINLKTNL